MGDESASSRVDFWRQPQASPGFPSRPPWFSSGWLMCPALCHILFSGQRWSHVMALWAMQLHNIKRGFLPSPPGEKMCRQLWAVTASSQGAWTNVFSKRALSLLKGWSPGLWARWPMAFLKAPHHATVPFYTEPRDAASTGLEHPRDSFQDLRFHLGQVHIIWDLSFSWFTLCPPPQLLISVKWIK